MYVCLREWADGLVVVSGGSATWLCMGEGGKGLGVVYPVPCAVCCGGPRGSGFCRNPLTLSVTFSWIFLTTSEMVLRRGACALVAGACGALACPLQGSGCLCVYHFLTILLGTVSLDMHEMTSLMEWSGLSFACSRRYR